MTKSKAPAGLKTAGRRLWVSVLDEYDLDEHESSLLLQAARTVDTLDRVATDLEGAPMTVISERGATRANPLLAEHARLSLTLSRLLASLRLPSGDESDMSRPQRRGAARGSYGIRGAV